MLGVVHVDVHEERVMLWVAAMELLVSMAGIVCLICKNCGYVGSFKLCREFLLLLNITDMDSLLRGKLWSA